LIFRPLPRYLALAACLAVLHAPAWAAVYKCTSADGHVTFSDRPCDRGAESMVRVPVPEAPPAVEPAAPEQPATETVTPLKPPTQVIQIDAAELPPPGAESAGGTGAYIPPLPEATHAPARSAHTAVIPAAAFPRPAARSYPSKPLATDTTTLANARRALSLLDGDEPASPPKTKPKRKRLFGLFSRKDR
jgi:hypothetical protein